MQIHPDITIEMHRQKLAEAIAAGEASRLVASVRPDEQNVRPRFARFAAPATRWHRPRGPALRGKPQSEPPA